MSMRLPTLLTAAVLTAAPLGVALTALPAAAATCTSPVAKAQIAPRTVVLDTAGTAHFDILVAVRANGCTVSAVDATVTSPTKHTTNLSLAAVGTVGDVTTYTGGVDLTAAGLDNADTGTWRVRTATHWASDAVADPAGDEPGDDDEVGDDSGDNSGDDSGSEPGDDSGTEPGDGSGTEPGDGSGHQATTAGADSEDEPGETEADEPVIASAKVAVLAAADLTADATSSQLKKGRITKGKALTVKGTLLRADWDAASHTGYAKQKVELQFRTAKGGFKKVKELKTGRGGSFAESVKASKDGCYRVVFAGSKTTAPAPSKAECIDVR
jgi:hypothetical protein